MSIASNLRRNAFPIEAALEAQSCGTVTIAITSGRIGATVTSRHSSRKLLGDIADIVIDNHVPVGDVAIEIPDHPARMVPISTLTGVFIPDMVLAGAVAALAAGRILVDAYHSTNAPGAGQSSEVAANRWERRVVAL